MKIPRICSTSCLTGLLLLSAGIPILATRADARGVVEAVELPGTPAIDGHIDETIWGNVEWQAGFRSVRNLAPADPDTRFKVGYNATHLFFLIQCDKPGIDTEPASSTTASLDLWQDEGVEIFIAPQGPRGPIYQILANAWGTAFSHIIDRGAWTPAIAVDATRDTEGWTLELAIPFEAFGVPNPTVSRTPSAIHFEQTLGMNGELMAFEYEHYEGDSGAPLAWRFNVCRNSGGHWSFAPFRGGFNQPEKFVALSFAESAGIRFEQDTDSQALQYINRIVYEQTFNYLNTTDRTRELVLRAAFEEHNAVFETGIVLDPGASRRITASLPAPTPGGNMLRLTLHETTPDGETRILRTDRLVREFAALPFHASFQLPFYRDTLFASQPSDALKALVRLDPDHLDRLGQELVVDLRTADGQTVIHENFTIQATEQEVALPVPELQPGMYRLSIRAKPEGTAFFEATRAIQVVPRAEYEWLVSSDGRLTYNGSQFFARGYVSGAHGGFGVTINADTLRRLAAEHEVNTHLVMASRHMDAEAVTVMLDRHRDTGVFALSFPYTGDIDRDSIPLTITEENAIRERVRHLRGHDALMGYILAAFPSDRLGARQRLIRIAEIVSEEDPYRLLVSLHNSIPGFRALNDAADIRIITLDPRPDSPQDQRLHTATAFARAAATSRKQSSAFWIAVGLARETVPPANELHALIQTGLLHGTGGILLLGAE